jgi:protoporphyrinogen oxidase
MDVAVVGGGITGLACAHYLLGQGLRPVVLEATRQFGSLSARIRHRNLVLDGFHLPFRRQDTALCGLVSDLHLDHLLRWRRATQGVALPSGQRRQISRSLDLLGWPGLPLASRLRALSATYASLRLYPYIRSLDDITAADWLSKLYGKRTFEHTWRPLLEALFSAEYAEEVPAYRAWQRLRHELGPRPPIRGYLRGGLDVLCQKLAKSIVERGGEVHLGTPVHGFEASAERVVLDLGEKELAADAVVLTPGLAELTSLGQSFQRGAAWTLPLSEPQRELSLVSALVLARAEARPFYSTLSLDRETPFRVVVDAGQLIPSELTAGLRPVYLQRLCHPVTGAYRLSDEVWTKQAIETLRMLDPGFDSASIERVEIFRAPGVDPAWPVGSMARRTAPRASRGPIYLCTSNQIYPREPGPDAAIMQAREVVTRLSAEL